MTYNKIIGKVHSLHKKLKVWSEVSRSNHSYIMSIVTVHTVSSFGKSLSEFFSLKVKEPATIFDSSGRLSKVPLHVLNVGEMPLSLVDIAHGLVVKSPEDTKAVQQTVRAWLKISSSA